MITLTEIGGNPGWRTNELGEGPVASGARQFSGTRFARKVHDLDLISTATIVELRDRPRDRNLVEADEGCRGERGFDTFTRRGRPRGCGAA
jgi:hypothetical protein